MKQSILLFADTRKTVEPAASSKDTYQHGMYTNNQTPNRDDPRGTALNRMLPNGDKNAPSAHQGVPTSVGAAIEDVDLSLFLKEIRQLYNQLELTINNNNLLRAKLEERLTLPHGGATAALVEGRLTTDTSLTRQTGEFMIPEHCHLSWIWCCGCLEWIEHQSVLQSAPPPHVVVVLAVSLFLLTVNYSINILQLK